MEAKLETGWKLKNAQWKDGCRKNKFRQELKSEMGRYSGGKVFSREKIIGEWYYFEGNLLRRHDE